MVLLLSGISQGMRRTRRELYCWVCSSRKGFLITSLPSWPRSSTWTDTAVSHAGIYYCGVSGLRGPDPATINHKRTKGPVPSKAMGWWERVSYVGHVVRSNDI